MFIKILYALAIGSLVVSYFRNREKTRLALKKALKSLENILPQFLSVLVLIGLGLSILRPETITRLLGENSGALGILAASLIGSITLIPGFIAFPLAAVLLKNGAGYMQIAAFVSTLMMVGIITLPMEISTFGRRAALVRNISAYLFSLLAAFIIGIVM